MSLEQLAQDLYDRGVRTRYNAELHRLEYTLSSERDASFYPVRFWNRQDTADVKKLMRGSRWSPRILQERIIKSCFLVMDTQGTIKEQAYRKYPHETCDVHEWVKSVPWDGVDRIELVLDTLRFASGVTAEERHKRREQMKICFRSMAHVFMWWGAVVDERSRGISQYGLPMLIGPEGCGKTAWVQHLAPRWIYAGTEYRHARDMRLLSSAWITEIVGFLPHREREFLTYLKFNTQANGKPNLAYFIATGRKMLFSPLNVDCRAYPFHLERCDVFREKTPAGLPCLEEIDMQQFWAQVGSHPRCEWCPR